MPTLTTKFSLNSFEQSAQSTYFSCYKYHLSNCQFFKNKFVSLSHLCLHESIYLEKKEWDISNQHHNKKSMSDLSPFDFWLQTNPDHSTTKKRDMKKDNGGTCRTLIVLWLVWGWSFLSLLVNRWSRPKINETMSWNFSVD